MPIMSPITHAAENRYYLSLRQKLNMNHLYGNFFVNEININRTQTKNIICEAK